MGYFNFFFGRDNRGCSRNGRDARWPSCAAKMAAPHAAARRDGSPYRARGTRAPTVAAWTAMERRPYQMVAQERDPPGNYIAVCTH